MMWCAPSSFAVTTTPATRSYASGRPSARSREHRVHALQNSLADARLLAQPGRLWRRSGFPPRRISPAGPATRHHPVDGLRHHTRATTWSATLIISVSTPRPARASRTTWASAAVLIPRDSASRCSSAPRAHLRTSGQRRLCRTRGCEDAFAEQVRRQLLAAPAPWGLARCPVRPIEHGVARPHDGKERERRARCDLSSLRASHALTPADAVTPIARVVETLTAFESGCGILSINFAHRPDRGTVLAHARECHLSFFASVKAPSRPPRSKPSPHNADGQSSPARRHYRELLRVLDAAADQRADSQRFSAVVLSHCNRHPAASASLRSASARRVPTGHAELISLSRA
jgi:hypothetical protein